MTSRLNLAAPSRGDAWNRTSRARRPASGLIAPIAPIALIALILAVAAGCAGPERAGGGPAAPDEASSASAAAAPTAPPDTARPATRPAAGTPGAATSSTALVWVNGMGCPLCATNVDQQLKRVPGVTSVAINLGTGIVSVGIDPAKPPGEAALARAVEDSGFTLVRIQMPVAAGGGA